MKLDEEKCEVLHLRKNSTAEKDLGVLVGQTQKQQKQNKSLDS